MAEKKSYPEEMFEWRRQRYRAAPRTKLPHQEAFEASLRVNALAGAPAPGLPPGLPLDLYSESFEFDPIWQAAVLAGVGGAVKVGAGTCMVGLARAFLGAFQPASCGDCTVCRIGVQRLTEILDRIEAGEGEPDDVERLEDVAATLRDASRCELGRAAAGPVVGTLLHFRESYLEHILERRCRAGTCRFGQGGGV